MPLPTFLNPKSKLISIMQTRFNAIGLTNAPVVTDAYPEEIQTIRQRAVISVREVSSQALRRFIGGQFTEQYDQAAHTVTSSHGYIEQSAFEITIWAINAELRDVLSHLLRLTFNMEATKQAYLSEDIMWLAVESGADEHIEDETGARVIFTRTFSAIAWYFIIEQEIANAITQVNAIISSIQFPEE